MDHYWPYWGKADPEVAGGHHLAAFHCLDVAAVCETMLERNAVLRRKFARMMGVEEARVGATLAVLVALHDIGKFDVRFQAKAPQVAGVLNPAWRGLPRPTSYDHGSWGYQQLLDLSEFEPGLFSSTIGSQAVPLLQAVCGHHGAFPSHGGGAQDPRYRTFRQADRQARKAFLAAVVELYEPLGAQYPVARDASMQLMVLLAGFCSVADWLGSQAEGFPYRGTPLALDRYRALALSMASALLEELPISSASPTRASFGVLFEGKSPRDVQLLTEQISVSSEPFLAIVEATMGSGKTEAALSLASRMVSSECASGVFVALPTMATSNGMFERIEDVAPRMFHGKLNLRLAHGRARSFDPFDRLVQRSLAGRLPAAEAEGDVVCARWFLSRKRALLGQLGVGTVDQAMQAVIKVRHHFVRGFGLAQQVVILDEVHAYDAYMEVILERLVEWLGALRAPVVLLSATLPGERRSKFLRAYAEGAGWDWSEDLDASPTCTPYPCVKIARASGVATHSADPPTDRRVVLRQVASPGDGRAVLDALREAAQEGATVCWIRNSVGEAQAAYDDAARNGLKVELFHARFRGRDRSDIERRVLSDYGPKSNRKGRILIATQVVEQSLDLDFDLLATDLCPIDLLLQRCGRLHRHPIPRPAGCEAAALIIHVPSREDVDRLRFGVSARIYDAPTLWLAYESLQNRSELLLPGDIRRLVEESYHPSIRSARLEKGSSKLRDAETRRLDDLEARRRHASVVCVPHSTIDPSAIAGCHDDDDDEVQALTRDGESTTLLLVRWDGESDEGASLDTGESWNLDSSAPQAWKTARALHEELVSMPAWPWDGIERGARARGEWRAWEGWERRCLAFLKAMGMGRVIVVPVVERENEYSGQVLTREGNVKRLRYSRSRGLWFPKEES